MKKITLILFSALCLFYSNLYAQKGWSYGGKAGINISSANIKDDNSDVKSKIGYNIGFIADYNFTPQIFFRSGLDFISKGAVINDYDYWSFFGTESSAPSKRLYSKSKYTLNYVQVPFMLGYRIPINNHVSIFANGGLYVGYRIYGSKKRISYLIDEPSIISRDIFIDKFDCGYVGGIGAECGIFSLIINYEGGLFNTMAGKMDGGDPSWKNRNWNISLGYKF